MPYASTPRSPFGSSFLACAAILVGCGASAAPAAADEAGEARPSDASHRADTAASAPQPEDRLGVSDTGIFSDLDDQIQIGLPADAAVGSVKAVVDRPRSLVVAYVDGWPAKVYPITGDSELSVGDVAVSLRPGDADELSKVLADGDLSELSAGATAAPGDADEDGIPDPLDILIGAHKTVVNGADYGAGYVRMDYPNGDVPRDRGVCTDVIVRAVRNAGTDLQSELHDDIRRSKRSYPMVKKRNSHIDHRRVKTILPYFLRNWDRRSAALDDERDPLRPGDVVFMDTFPSRKGPDHIGIISNRTDSDGRPLVINNWTNGTKTAEMNLLGWVPVTHRFRYPTD